MNQYALILAGGSGTRFWPLSRDHRPKQLLNMFGEGTLLRQAIDRLDGLVPRQNIFILTNHLQEAEVRRQAHDIPVDNIISEPVRRDTAPAIALGIGLIKAADPHGVMLVSKTDLAGIIRYANDAFVSISGFEREELIGHSPMEVLVGALQGLFVGWFVCRIIYT